LTNKIFIVTILLN